jgi:hypothetical protein
MMILIKGQYEVRKYDLFFAERFGETDEFEEDLEKMAPRSLKTLPLYREETYLAICLRNWVINSL